MSDNVTVVTIEDEPAVRRGLAAYLEDSGYQVLEAGDGAAGIALVRACRPDAVLCDLRLPKMDGLEVLSTITTEFPETPVIVVSGVSDLSYAVQALKRGAWDYVTKPILDMGVLEGALGRALERSRLLGENRRYRLHLEALNRELTRTLHQLQADEEAARRIQFQLLPADRWSFGDYLFTRQLYPSKLLSGDRRLFRHRRPLRRVLHGRRVRARRCLRFRDGDDQDAGRPVFRRLPRGRRCDDTQPRAHAAAAESGRVPAEPRSVPDHRSMASSMRSEAT